MWVNLINSDLFKIILIIMLNSVNNKKMLN